MSSRECLLSSRRLLEVTKERRAIAKSYSEEL